jgi:hypothetical protein
MGKFRHYESLYSSTFDRLEQAQNAKKGERSPEPEKQDKRVDVKSVKWRALTPEEFHRTRRNIIANNVTVPAEMDPPPAEEFTGRYTASDWIAAYSNVRFFDSKPKRKPGEIEPCPFDDKFWKAIEDGMEHARVMERGCSVLWAKFEKFKQRPWE